MMKWTLAAGILALICCFLSPAYAQKSSADLDDNGFVDSNDMYLFQQQWHTAGTAPEQTISSEILDVEIPADNRPLVTFTLVNQLGDPVDPADLRRFRFIIARIIEDDLANNRSHYENYIYETVTGAAGTFDVPTYDQGGVVTDLGNGQYTYKFVTALENVDPTLTHTLGIQMDLDQVSVINPLFNFVPNGDPVTVIREVSTTATCNECHDPLAIHGGGRREFVMCLLCHHQDVFDAETGNSIDMKVMTHKIHMGAALPSVQSGTPYVIENSDFSDVVFPQDHRNCTKCHTGPQADHWRLVPARAPCTACHDDIDIDNGIGHIMQTNDSLCSACHPPIMTTEFDATVPGAHVIPEKSAQLPGYNADITEVSNVVAGASPTITFSLFEDDLTPVDPATTDRLRVNFAGPTTDYMAQFREDITNPTDNMDGTWTFTLMNGIPGDAMGTWAFAIETRREVTIVGKEGADLVVREGADNPVVYQAVTGDLLPRRQLVDQDKCHVCHDQLAFHGDQRRTVEYCVFCHRPGQTDEADRPPEAMPPETVDMKVMIHKIHRGHDLVNGYIVYGSPDDFSEVHYPGDLRNCEACHLAGTYDPPPPDGVIDTVITQGGVEVERFGPTTAACTGCHDSDEALAHARSNTASPGGEEACAVCHGADRSASVFAVHAR